MTHITLSNGMVLKTEMKPTQVIAAFHKVAKEGKEWVPLEGGAGFYRASAVVSVTDGITLDALGMDEFEDLLFGGKES